MSMRTLFAAVIGIGWILVLSGLSLSKETVVESKWTASSVRVDGLNVEWLTDPLSSEKDVNVDYAFKNDGRNLYILFVFKDAKYLSSIDATGMTVYFSSAGKKQKDFGVRFVKKTVNADGLIATLERQGTFLSEEKKKQIKSKPQYVLFEADAVNKKGEVISPSGPRADVEPPAFMTTKQANAVTFEFRIPLASREIHPAGIGAEPGMNLKIGFEWGGLTYEMKRAMSSRMAGDGTRAQATDVSLDETIQGGNENEGMRGDSSGSSLARMRMGPQKYSFWVDLKLAQNQ